jgi:hypothetical protein
MPRTTSSSWACNCGTRCTNRSALPDKPSTAFSEAMIWSAFLPSGAQVRVTVAIGPDTPAAWPKRSLSCLMSPSICARVALKSENEPALPPIASRPWLASFCEFTCRSDADVLAPPRRAAFQVA